MKRKILFLALILLVLAATVAYYTATTKPHSMVITGIVTTNDVIVSAQIQGQLAQLLVKEGDTVQAGQLVAVIEPEELRADKAFYAHTEQGTAAQVQQAEATLQYQEKQTRDQIQQAEAALASTQAQQAEAEADLELDRVNLERAEGLFKQSIVSAQSLDQARATYEAQKAHVESLRKQVDVQRAAVALAHSRPWPIPTKTRSRCGEMNSSRCSGSWRRRGRRSRKPKSVSITRKSALPSRASSPACRLARARW